MPPFPVAPTRARWTHSQEGWLYGAVAVTALWLLVISLPHAMSKDESSEKDAIERSRQAEASIGAIVGLVFFGSWRMGTADVSKSLWNLISDRGVSPPKVVLNPD